jgi:hypothetical protein
MPLKRSQAPSSLIKATKRRKTDDGEENSNEEEDGGEAEPEPMDAKELVHMLKTGFKLQPDPPVAEIQDSNEEEAKESNSDDEEEKQYFFNFFFVPFLFFFFCTVSFVSNCVSLHLRHHHQTEAKTCE